MIKKFLPFPTAFLANAFTIHLQQAGGLEEDWGSFLRNIAFFKVLAQKDRNHCWIYSPSHCCLWVRCKSCVLINLLLRPFFFHLHFDLITFVSLRFIFFPPLLFSSRHRKTCQVAEHSFCFNTEEQFRGKCLTILAKYHSFLLFTLNTSSSNFTPGRGLFLLKLSQNNHAGGRISSDKKPTAIQDFCLEWNLPSVLASASLKCFILKILFDF